MVNHKCEASVNRLNVRSTVHVNRHYRCDLTTLIYRSTGDLHQKYVRWLTNVLSSFHLFKLSE